MAGSTSYKRVQTHLSQQSPAQSSTCSPTQFSISVPDQLLKDLKLEHQDKQTLSPQDGKVVSPVSQGSDHSISFSFLNKLQADDLVSDTEQEPSFVQVSPQLSTAPHAKRDGDSSSSDAELDWELLNLQGIDKSSR